MHRKTLRFRPLTGFPLFLRFVPNAIGWWRDLSFRPLTGFPLFLLKMTNIINLTPQFPSPYGVSFVSTMIAIRQAYSQMFPSPYGVSFVSTLCLKSLVPGSL